MILKNVSLIPELSGGYDAPTACVWIKDRRIEKIAPEIQIPGETEMDCGGRTLLPGFIDMHTHIVYPGVNSPTEARVPMKVLVNACALVPHYLDYGFTTIRDCGCALRASNSVREMQKMGLIESPRIIACGQTICPTEVSYASTMAETEYNIDCADGVRKAVRREFAEQADFIKIYASGSAFNPKGKPLQPIMMEDEVAMAVKVASMKGSYVAAHAHSDNAIRLCVDSGVYTIEHATYISDETIQVLKGKTDCYLVPTLSAMYCNPGNDSPFWKKRMGDMLEASGVCLRRAYQAGLKMGFGTDTIPGKGQYANGIEFQYRKDYMGESNLDILLQATKYSAEILGYGDTLGNVREGYEADLTLVDGDPVKDLSVLYHKPDYVFQAGKLVRDNTKERAE